MTKGFLCILAAVGTSLLSGQAFGEDLGNGAETTVTAAATSRIRAAQKSARNQARLLAARIKPTNVAGWQVVERSGDQIPAIYATNGSWTIAADSREGDRLNQPRVIGPDITIWAVSGTLVAGGVSLDDLFVVSKQHSVRAAHARLTLEPTNVELVDVGSNIERAE